MMITLGFVCLQMAQEGNRMQKDRTLARGTGFNGCERERVRQTRRAVAGNEMGK